MSRLKPSFAFPLSRLIQAGILVLSFVCTFIPARTTHADNPPPILPGGWHTFTTANAPIAEGGVSKIFKDSQGRVWIVASGSDLDSRQDSMLFLHRLEGHERDWHTTKTHETQYTSLRQRIN